MSEDPATTEDAAALDPEPAPVTSDDSPRWRRVKKERKRRGQRPKPTHYKVICISMYVADIEALDAKVDELKRRGCTRASKSQLIRIALDQLDMDRAASRLRGAR